MLFGDTTCPARLALLWHFRLRPVQVCCLGYRKPAFSNFPLFMSVPCKARVAIRMESHQFSVDVGSDCYHFLHYVLAESQKFSGFPSIGAWQGGTYTYPKWPRMQNICKIHVKHTHLRLWNVCDAYVKRMCSASENICEPYVKHMWKHMRNTCGTFTYFGTGLRCVYVLLMYTSANLCFLCRKKNKALFCANHAK